MVNPRYLVAVLALFLECHSAVFDCYNTKCVGTGPSNETYIDCDQSINECSTNTTGYPTCNATQSGGDGVNCTHTNPLDFFCNVDVTSGAASCSLTPEQSCYSLRCYGTGAKNASFVACDGSTDRCSSDESGAPVCMNDARGSGVNCTTTKPYYCAYEEPTLTAPTCKYPEAYDCFNTKCGDPSKPDTLVDCPQDKGHCSVNATDGSPICVSSNSTLTGDGVLCPHTDPLDFFCNVDVTSGAASCSFTPEHNCYSLRCYGTGAKNASFIACDGSTDRCSSDESGAPVCMNDARGSGVECNTTKPYYCAYEEPTLTAPTCKYPEAYDCFNTKCGDPSKPDTLVDCPQDKGHCSVNSTDGSPICVSSNSTLTGDGVLCPHTDPLDFFCNVDVTSGAASCSFTPEHSCYSQRCYGTGAKNASFIACDGSTDRCSSDESGAPVCINDARGSGLDCNTTKPYYCAYEEPTLTAPTCQYPEAYDCFNTKCGDPSKKDDLIDCPQDKGHCSVNATDGSPICVSSNSTTGDGVYCLGKFSCKEDSKTGVASCHTKKSLLPLWVVLGVIGAIALVVIIIWVVKSRSQGDDQTPLL